MKEVSYAQLTDVAEKDLSHARIVRSTEHSVCAFQRGITCEPA